MSEELVTTEIGERRASLLQQVREGLKADSKVYFAGEILHSPYGSGWLEAVDIIVSPTKPVYDADKLNQFMDNLVPDIPRSARDEARKYDDKSDFRLGRLYFDETLGITKKEIKTTTTTVEPQALDRAGVHIGESHHTEEEPLERRTWVRVYPDVDSAQIIAEYERGLKEGTVEPNRDFEYMKHGFSAEQFRNIKRNRNKLHLKLKKLAKGN